MKGTVMYGNTISPQDIVNVVRQGQREGFVAGVVVSVGVWVFAKVAGPNVKEFLNKNVNLNLKKSEN